MKLYNDDCLKVMKDIPDKSIDLVITDPPYEYRITKGGGFMTNENKKSLEELRIKSLDKGFNPQILKELVRVMKKINIYIWASKDQIPMLIKYFVEEIGCAFDILCWNKTNAMPLFNNKYLTDKEYCLYFRKGGYCQPISYECAKTIFNLSINYKDKKMYGHPTIKPLSIIKTMIQNSSKENDIVLDCFMGSGTTGVACRELKRDFIGIEIDKTYFEIAQQRIFENIKREEKVMNKTKIKQVETQPTIFDYMESVNV